MRPKPVLYVVAVMLAVAAIGVPLFLRQIPLPLRLAAGFINLLASFAVAMVIRQAGNPKLPKSKMPNSRR